MLPPWEWRFEKHDFAVQMRTFHLNLAKAIFGNYSLSPLWVGLVNVTLGCNEDPDSSYSGVFTNHVTGPCSQQGLQTTQGVEHIEGPL